MHTGRGTHNALKAPEEIECYLIPQEGVRHHAHGNKCAAEDEYQALAEDVGDAAPQEQEAAEGDGVGGDDPLQPAVRDPQVFTYGGQGDNDGLDRKGLALVSIKIPAKARGGGLTFRKLAPVTVRTNAMARAFERGSAGFCTSTAVSITESVPDTLGAPRVPSAAFVPISAFSTSEDKGAIASGLFSLGAVIVRRVRQGTESVS